MPDRIFVDANVLFSAAYSPDSRVGLLFELAHRARVDLLASPFVIEEARRNLALKRPTREAQLDALLGKLLVVPNVDRRAVGPAYGLPLKDLPVLLAAMSGQAAMLVTGDATHFGHLYGHVGDEVLVTTVAGAIERLLEIP